MDFHWLKNLGNQDMFTNISRMGYLNLPSENFSRCTKSVGCSHRWDFFSLLSLWQGCHFFETAHSCFKCGFFLFSKQLIAESSATDLLTNHLRFKTMDIHGQKKQKGYGSWMVDWVFHLVVLSPRINQAEGKHRHFRPRLSRGKMWESHLNQSYPEGHL